MKKNGKVILAVISAACIALTACSKNTTDTSTSETAETATSETASAVEYDLGLDDDGYFRDVTASKYISSDAFGRGKAESYHGHCCRHRCLSPKNSFGVS